MGRSAVSSRHMAKNQPCAYHCSALCCLREHSNVHRATPGNLIRRQLTIKPKLHAVLVLWAILLHASQFKMHRINGHLQLSHSATSCCISHMRPACNRCTVIELPSARQSCRKNTTLTSPKDMSLLRIQKLQSVSCWRLKTLVSHGLSSSRLRTSISSCVKSFMAKS